MPWKSCIYRMGACALWEFNIQNHINMRFAHSTLHAWVRACINRVRVTVLPAVVAGNYFGVIDFAPYATYILMAWLAVFVTTIATMFKIRRLAFEVTVTLNIY